MRLAAETRRRFGLMARWAALIAVLPNLVLSSLTGREFLLHHHDDHGVHAHEVGRLADGSPETRLMNVHADVHGDDEDALNTPDVRPAEPASIGAPVPDGVVIRLPAATPTIVKVRAGDLRTVALPICELSIVWPRDHTQSDAVDVQRFRGFETPCISTDDAIALILRANHAILI